MVENKYSSPRVHNFDTSDRFGEHAVQKPFSVEKSVIAPAFDQPGEDVQYRVITPEGVSIRVNIDYLLKNGYLK